MTWWGGGGVGGEGRCGALGGGGDGILAGSEGWEGVKAGG